MNDRSLAHLFSGLRALALFTLLTGCGDSESAPRDEGETSTSWIVDNLSSIGGHMTSVVGEPVVVETELGAAVQFDGVNDALFVEAHPLAELQAFTAEVVFRPDPDGAVEQRFFHMQATASPERVMFETRTTADGRWFLDTFIRSSTGEVTLYAEASLHDFGTFYRAAIVVDGTRMRHYVNGVEELSADLAYTPQAAGRTSIGTRLTSEHWFKGAVRMARFTPRALGPNELLTP